MFNVTPGPYKEGQTIDIRCEVARIQGPVSPTNLTVHVGKSPLIGSQKKSSHDGTFRLFVNESFTVSSSMDGKDIYCRYNSPNGTFQRGNATIRIITLDNACEYKNNSL